MTTSREYDALPTRTPTDLKLATTAITIALLISGCRSGVSEIVLSGPTMGTTYTVRIVAPPKQITPHQLRLVVEEELRAVDESMSGYRHDSELSRFNAAIGTDWFDVSRDLSMVIEAALEVTVQSSCAFDVTVAPLVHLWGFGPSGNEGAGIPDATAIAAAKELVVCERLQARLDPPALRKPDAAIQIDLNGIAPGYAVDRIAARLEALTVKHYMVDIGGEIRVRGRNKAGALWRVAVERPEEGPLDTREMFMMLQVENRAVATSGEYRRYVRKGGLRYSHTIDPRTGSPITHALASVVVIHNEATYADAWATAYNVLGPKEGYELAARLSMPVMFITEENGALEAKMTPAFERFVSAPGQ